MAKAPRDDEHDEQAPSDDLTSEELTDATRGDTPDDTAADAGDDPSGDLGGDAVDAGDETRGTAPGPRDTTTGKRPSRSGNAGKRKAGATERPMTRRQRLAALEAQRKAAERRRSLILLGVCLAVAIALLAYPVYRFIDDTRLQNTPVEELGVAADAAGCLPVEENPATGNQEHVPDGTVVQYPRLPPDSGPHFQNWADFSQKFYTMEDRPAVENLVHNLEHGYLLMWYRSSLDAADVREVRAIARTFSGTSPRDKVIAAPWDPATDGGDFPTGTNITLARWYADPAAPTDTTKQKGIRLSCAEVSGAVVKQFRDDYPSEAAPEPNGG